jgi:hypothetical protein
MGHQVTGTCIRRKRHETKDLLAVEQFQFGYIFTDTLPLRSTSSNAIQYAARAVAPKSCMIRRTHGRGVVRRVIGAEILGRLFAHSSLQHEFGRRHLQAGVSSIKGGQNTNTPLGAGCLL